MAVKADYKAAKFYNCLPLSFYFNIFSAVYYLIHHLPQEALQQHMQNVQEENALLRKTLEQTPNDLDKLHRQVCK
jgi:hypothetical protein